jgi:hypothetical protein
MTKKELVALVDAVYAMWPDERVDMKAAYVSWWRYLGDLGFTETQKALDAHVIANNALRAKYGRSWGTGRPTPGDLRQMAIDGSVSSWPEAEEALHMIEEWYQRAQTGLEFRSTGNDELDDALRQTASTAHSNKQAFLARWRTMSAERALARYAVPDTAPSLGTE